MPELSAIVDAKGAARYVPLCMWWRANRHPRIAALAIAVALRDGPAGVIGASKRKLDHEAWLRLAKFGEPLDVRRLVAALPKTNTVQCLARLEALREVDDPHIVPGLFALLRAPPARNASGKPLWQHVVARLAGSNDVRVRDELAEYLPGLASYMDSSTGDWLRRRLVALADDVPPEPPPLSSDEDAALRELERQIPLPPRKVLTARTRATADELLAQIYAAPDDDGPRTVYADVVGGAVGELIVAQIAGSTAQPEARLAAKLLGPLGGICSSATFVRGFPEEVTIWKQRPSAIRPAIGLPGWRLVRSITVANGSQWPKDPTTAAVKLLSHPVMSRLDRLAGIPLEVVERLVAIPSAARLRSLEVHSWGDSGTAWAGPAKHLAAFPALRELAIHSYRQGPYALPPGLVERLDAIEIQGHDYQWWRPLADRGARNVRFVIMGTLLELERTATGLDRATLTVQRGNAIVRLDTLPEGALRDVVVRCPPRGPGNMSVDPRLAITAQLARFPGASVRYE